MKAVPHDSRVVKKLAPQAAGAKRLSARFGDALVCVRYRRDDATGRRYTTVELVVAEKAGAATAPQEVSVRVAYGETDLRRRIKEAGGRWQPDRKLWRLARAQAKTLGLLQRVVPDTR